MKRFQLEITLTEELVLSARSSTVGGNHSLDYIPGASLLGVAAASLYDTLDSATAFHLFHSGKVRFGNALPLSPMGERGMPVPLAWHTGKGATIHQTGHEQWLDGSKIDNFCRQQPDASKKQVQIRGGYVTESGYLLHPASQFRMKTAIDPTTAKAATAQLFGYQSLQAGQQFRAWVDVDDGVLDDPTLDALKTCLQGRVQVGRSRSAQYGEICCTVRDKSPVEPLSANSKAGGTLTVWLQADMALQDEYGQPTLTPTPEHFGIQGQLLEAETFLRTRSYSPYNGKRRSYDPVCQVLEKGSVITFKLTQALDSGTLERLQRGIGAYRESGLGQVSLNHPLLTQALPTPPIAATTTVASVGTTPDHPLARWVYQRSQGGNRKRETREAAEAFAMQLGKLYDAARRYAGRPQGDLVGPSTTQWGRVYEKAKALVNTRQPDELLAGLFSKDNPQAICKVGDEGWYAATGLGGEQATFAEWLQHILTQQQGKDTALLIANLAQQARAVAKQKEGKR